MVTKPNTKVAEEALSKAIDELLDEYEVLVKSGDLSSREDSLSPDGEQGQSLTPNDSKGGLPQPGGQGAPRTGLGDEPTAMGAEVKVAGPKAPKQRGDGMGTDEVAIGGPAAPAINADSGDGMGTSAVAGPGGVAKAEDGGKVPPGFKGQDKDKSKGAEDEEDEDHEGEDEDADEGDEDHAEEGEGEAGSEDEDGDEHQDGPPGTGEGGEGEDEGDAAIDQAVEKALYKFMAKIGMGGDYAKSEEDVEALMAKSEDDGYPVIADEIAKAVAAQTVEMQKSADAKISKFEGEVDELKQLVKSLTSTIEKLAKAPAAKPRSVAGYTPLRKTADGTDAGAGSGDAQPLTKAQISEKCFAMLKSGKITDRTIVMKIDLAPNAAAAAEVARAAGVEV